MRAKTTSTGWAAIRLVSPAAVLTNKATYRLMCTVPSGTIGLSAYVTPTTRTVACGSAPPSFTFTGRISSQRAGTVTYHWVLSDGTTSPFATLTFTGPGTQDVQALTVTPPADTANGGGMLVVTSPGMAASSPAYYSLTCTATGQPPSPKLSIQTSKLPSAQVGTSYSQGIVATGGDGKYTWSASGLPPGLSLSPGGTISGTPTKGGQYPVSLTVTDGESPTPQTATGTVTITVNYPPLSITGPGSLGPCNYLGINPGCPAAQFRATGGDGNYTWSATGLPGGVTISSSGVFSGDPTEYAGSPYTVKVTVTDGTGTSASMTYQLVVNNES